MLDRRRREKPVNRRQRLRGVQSPPALRDGGRDREQALGKAFLEHGEPTLEDARLVIVAALAKAFDPLPYLADNEHTQKEIG